MTVLKYLSNEELRELPERHELFLEDKQPGEIWKTTKGNNRGVMLEKGKFLFYIEIPNALDFIKED